MGKYDGLVSKLPKLTAPTDTSPAYQDRIDQAKTELRGLDVKALAKHYIETRKQADALHDALSKLNVVLEACTALLVESQEQGAEGWGQYGASPNMLRLVSGDKIQTQVEPYTATEDSEAIREWFIKNDMERLLKPLWQTVNSMNKERLLEGKSEIPGTKVWLKTKVVYTAMKPEKAAAAVAATNPHENDDLF